MRWRIVGLLALAACTRSPSSSPARTSDGSAAPEAAAEPAPGAPAAAPTAPTTATPAGNPPVTPTYTEVTLKSQSSPTAKVGGLTLTLLGAIEVAQPKGEKVAYTHRVKLRVESGADKREIFLMGESTVLGHTLTLKSAGDGQADPHAPREAIAVIGVKPAP